MKYFTNIFVIVLFTVLPLQKSISQQITGKVIDSKTKEALPFVTIQFGENKGVISNMEGFFTFFSGNINPSQDVTFSNMGYNNKVLTLKELEKIKEVSLETAVDQLETVYLTNKFPDAESIMKMVNENLEKNYNSLNVKYKFFSRKTGFLKTSNTNFEITKSKGFSKSKIQESNQQLDELFRKAKNTLPKQQFIDVLAEVYVKDPNNVKLNIVKATQLIDEKNTISFEKLSEQATNIILKHLNKDKIYTLKTGLFTLDDSLSLVNEKKTTIEDKTKVDIDNLKSSTKEILNDYMFEENSMLDFVLNTSIYEYHLENVTNLQGKLVYIINFQPKKHRAKYEGKLYISEEDYGILQIDYNYAKGKTGEKLNLKLLFGLKFSENYKKGTIIYKKQNNSYYLYYINQEIGRYIYMHRPLKLIENSNRSKKVAFDLMLEGDFFEKFELLDLSSSPLDNASFNQVKEAETSQYEILKKYDPSLWKNLNIIEPLEEMKQFRVIE